MRLARRCPGFRGAGAAAGLVGAFIIASAAFLGTGCSRREPPRFDGENAFRYLAEQCALGPRYPGSAAHAELRRYIAARLAEAGAAVSVQPFEAVLSSGDTLRLVNIIGTYSGGAAKRILLGAHYDTRPWADRDPDPARRAEPILGANDGASGVAVLLEIARLCGASKPPVGIDLVFFDGEDSGAEGSPGDYCLGSAYFASHLKGYRPAAVIVFDMVGETDARIPMEGYSAAASTGLVNDIYAIAAELSLGAFVREQGPAIIDDHLPFIQAGIPAIDLIDFDYPSWHTLGDTPDKCSPASLEAVGTVALHYLWRR